MQFDSTFMPIDPLKPDLLADRVRVARSQEASFVAGPGKRYVIWVAGCLRRCPGCFQPHFFDFAAGEPTSAEALAEEVLSIPDLDGVSISGGEPFEQSEALAKFCQLIKDQSDLTVLAYSGYRLDSLQANAKFSALLQYVDILIDGEFRQEQAGPYLWRGSANQRVLSRDSSGQWIPFLPKKGDGSPDLQVSVTDNQITITGFPDEQFQKAFMEQLSLRGIQLGRSKP